MAAKGQPPWLSAKLLDRRAPAKRPGGLLLAGDADAGDHRLVLRRARAVLPLAFCARQAPKTAPKTLISLLATKKAKSCSRFGANRSCHSGGIHFAV